MKDAHEPQDGLDAEHWGSCLLGAMDMAGIADPGLRQLFRSDLIGAIERIGTADALATLRALSGVGGSAERARAKASAERLAARGVKEPAWGPAVGTARPGGAVLMCEEVFDDGCSVFVEFTGPGHERHSLAIYIDHNLGGLVKDIFIAGPLEEVTRGLNQRPDPEQPVLVRGLDLAEARMKVMAGLEALDDTYRPPVDEDVPRLRALVEARMELLPEGDPRHEDLPDEMPQSERTALLDDFLASRHGLRWRGNADAEAVVATAIDFGADYNHGGPLRFSPTVIEIFMLSWLPRKAIREPAFFDVVAEVLPDWVAYTFVRRNVPFQYLAECAEAVSACREEMLEAVSDPTTWGPARTLAAAAQDAGVDLSDPGALTDFIDRYNAGNAGG